MHVTVFFHDDYGNVFTERGLAVARVTANGRVTIHTYVLDHGDVWRRADSYSNFSHVDA